MTDFCETNDATATDNAASTGDAANADGAKDTSKTVGWRDTTIDDAQERINPETAQAVQRIKRLRQSIDNVDTAIVSLLAERFKYTAEVGVLKAQAGFAPEDRERENRQAKRLKEVAIDAGLDPSIEENYREFVVTEAKKRHQRIAEAGGDPGVLDIYA
ncbi:chorismate mutase [Bifidobacterium sp. ESL0728]|uniref:chorismate mutase n=1 Tax=Bifidobacterium sp. ESL0728 TaxID=2983220 RepID=UPI0023F7E89E|nr:chorismate mutase [Bifidobacterium sp. ESL0728]WEV59269.1 chorismate mutase [Bifidobacterium sp. ESL0728]